MKLFKTCLFKNIGTIKLIIKANLFSNFRYMGGILATTATLSTAMVATIPIHADVSDTINQAKTTCETKLVCKELSDFIQAQINELEAKDDLTNDEKRLRYNLRKQLIALENQKQDLQQVALANEKSETVDILKTDQKIAELRGALLEK